MEETDALAALAGGGLIGAASVLMMLSLGRIAGIAGITGGLIGAARGDVGWRLAFLVGLIAGPFLPLLFGGSLPRVHIDASLSVVVLAGMLVGFGVRLGSGCTSGHGVCGLARLSPRSLAATLVFMATAMAVVFAVRHVFAG